jgi:hypothetical protein
MAEMLPLGAGRGSRSIDRGGVVRHIEEDRNRICAAHGDQ